MTCFRRFSFCLLLTICLSLSLFSIAAAAGYSADIVTTGKHGTSQSKIWVSYSSWSQRLEPASQPNMIMIVRMPQKLIWSIDTKTKRYMEIPMRSDMAAGAIATGDKAPTEVERTYLLTETVEGYLADKYRMTHQIGNDRITTFIWLIKDNNLFPIKSETKDGVTVFKNLVLEEPPASMFEVPPGYQKFSIPMMP